MRRIITAAALLLTLAAPAFAGDGWHHGNSWRWNGSNWVWGAPLLGAVAGAAVLGAIATPYYGYRWGYPYGPYTAYGPYGGYGVGSGYGYNAPIPLHQCQGPYGWYQC